MRRLVRWLLPISALGFVLALPLQERHDEHRVYSRELLDRAAAGAGNGVILADEAQADRLLWYEPQLAGRVAHDARMEVLPVDFIQAVVRAYDQPDHPASRRWRSRFAVIVVEREHYEPFWRSLSQDPDFSELGSDGHVTVFQRSPRAVAPAS